MEEKYQWKLEVAFGSAESPSACVRIEERAHPTAKAGHHPRVYQAFVGSEKSARVLNTTRLSGASWRISNSHDEPAAVRSA